MAEVQLREEMQSLSRAYSLIQRDKNAITCGALMDELRDVGGPRRDQLIGSQKLLHM